MGNQQSASRHSQSQSQSSTSSPSQTGHHSRSESNHTGVPTRPGRTRGSSQSYHRSFHSSSAGLISEASSSPYEPVLTPSSSLSPSLTRVETQYHYDQKHGSSLDSYVAGGQGVDPNWAEPPAMGAASSTEKLPKQRIGAKERDGGGSPHSAPLAVPSRTKSQSHRHQRESTPQNDSPGFFRPSGPPPEAPPRERASVSSVASSYAAATQPIFTQPPRLPLPIQEEELAPGSPVLSPTEFPGFAGHAPDLDDEIGLMHNRSLLSQTTADDDEEDDERGPISQQLDPINSGNNKGRTVNTEIVWRGHGDRIYVTGTFANWSKKYRMQHDPATGLAKLRLELAPGLHHVRFIVDGEMQLSSDLPTAVDWTNTLVNYVEVSADTAYRQPEADPHEGRADSVAPPPDVHPPLLIPARPTAHDHAARSHASLAHGSKDLYDSSLATPSEHTQHRKPHPELMELPERTYGQLIPGYLTDLDRDERTSRFARAQNRVSSMAPPPTLPGFLAKSILNMNTPTKDDSSVLNHPNHTMLNHLATSSIRQGVLATSLTTRYRRKYVTWITYRPTSLDE